MKTYNEHVNGLAESIVSTRDVCGDEALAVLDYLTDNGFPRGAGAPERDRMVAAARAKADEIWRASQVAAGVTCPIDADERAQITRTMERAP